MIAALLLQRMSAKRRIITDARAENRGKYDMNTCGKVCCRTCLGTDDLVLIFRNCDEEKMSHNLKLVTGLEIKRDDALSQKICKKCLRVFNLTMQFRRKSKKAEKALLEMLTVKPVKKYSINEDVKPKISKIDKEEVEQDSYMYDDVPLTDDFENDDEFDSKEDVKPIYVMKEQKPRLEKAVRQRGIKVPPGPPYKCNMCSKEFRMKATYSAHLRFHTNYCVCESCGKRCRNNNQLQEHKRARHGLGRIHKCAYCEYSSATKEALVIHERRHTGERPYICDHCGAAFHRRANLVQHIAIHLPDKNFQCDMCPKKLKSRKFLQIHKHNAHTGKRYGYLCSVCAHRFEKPNKVRAHTRRVHGVPDEQQGPIQRCTFCPTREKSKKRLQIHVSKAHREKRYSYKCPRCLKLFQRNEHAHRHLARVHHIPRADHPHIERVLIHNVDKDSYKPMPYQYGHTELYIHSDQTNLIAAGLPPV